MDNTTPTALMQQKQFYHHVSKAFQ